MSKTHGKDTVIKVGSDSVKGTTSQIERNADEHDVTEYGDDDGVYNGGIRRGTFTISGFYDTTTGTGPRAILNPAVGTILTIQRQPEGTGSGKAQDEFEALLTKYTETNPAADMVTWSADFRISGPVDSTAQPA